MAKSKKKFYTVWAGHEIGVFDSWATTQQMIKNFPGAKYKSFKTKAEAEKAFHDNYHDHIGNKKSQPKASYDDVPEIIQNSLSVDAACSGNPGLMEYRGVITKDGTEIFRKGPFPDGTNNIGEFLALVHALALCNKKDHQFTIYTDSRTAMAWVRNKKVKTTLKKTVANQKIFEMVERALHWLDTNSYNHKIIKWNTEEWGEIPADFGRK